MSLKEQIRQRYIKATDTILMLKKHGKEFRLFMHDKMPIIRQECARRGLEKLRKTQLNIWKIHYGTAYFTGRIKQNSIVKEVFIKIQGPSLSDCITNEILVNEWIKEHSPFLTERIPDLIDHFSIESDTIFVYDYYSFDSVTDKDKIKAEVKAVLEEYDRIGIIHTDFDLGNIGFYNGKYFFFDYGTALCPLSNNIRVREGKGYNHIEQITDEAKSLMADALYYYDDYVHFDGKNHSKNYVLGNTESYTIKLGETIYTHKRQLQQSIPQMIAETEIN